MEKAVNYFPELLQRYPNNNALNTALAFIGAYPTYRLVSGQFKGSSLPLPPGPKPLPVLGNLLDFPSDGRHEARYWAKHRALYGVYISLKITCTYEY